MQITLKPSGSDPCARWKTQLPLHSISWGCSKRVRHCDPLSSSLDVKVMKKSFIIALLKMSENKWQFCSIFWRILINSPRRDFLQSDRYWVNQGNRLAGPIPQKGENWQYWVSQGSWLAVPVPYTRERLGSTEQINNKVSRQYWVDQGTELSMLSE